MTHSLQPMSSKSTLRFLLEHRLSWMPTHCRLLALRIVCSSKLRMGDWVFALSLCLLPSFLRSFFLLSLTKSVSLRVLADRSFWISCGVLSALFRTGGWFTVFLFFPFISALNLGFSARYKSLSHSSAFLYPLGLYSTSGSSLFWMGSKSSFDSLLTRPFSFAEELGLCGSSAPSLNGSYLCRLAATLFGSAKAWSSAYSNR